jgi:hypothetical protein
VLTILKTPSVTKWTWSGAGYVRESPGEKQLAATDRRQVYKRARYYDATSGEFVSRDRLGFVNGRSLYRGYFAMRYVDPLGLYIVIPDEHDISIGFPEDAVTRCSSIWNWCITDVDFTVDPNNPNWSELEKYIDNLPKGDCIGNVIFNGHGSPGSAGPLTSGTVTNPKSDINRVLGKIKKRLCKDSRVDLRHCLCAKGAVGQKFLTNLAITIGAPVRGIDDIYAVNPHGDEYEALPNGTISKICSHGAYKDSWICAWQNGNGKKGNKPNKPKLKPRKCQKQKPDIQKPTLPHPFT